MIVMPVLRGGAGNCLFGMATAISYSLKHGVDYSLPITVESPHNNWNPVMHFKDLQYMWVRKEELKGNIQTYREQFFHYQEIPKYDCDYLFLDGYFQSRLFFDEHRTQILDMLAIPYKIEKGYVAIHVRRGDYLLLPNCHPVVSLEYIHSGIEYFINKGYKKFIVFTDDFKYCYENIKNFNGVTFEFITYRFEGIKENREVEDLSLASSCEHLIGCNSSFSWWIYYLNKNENKIGVFPQKDKWFGSALPHNVENLYMPEWVLI